MSPVNLAGTTELHARNLLLPMAVPGSTFSGLAPILAMQLRTPGFTNGAVLGGFAIPFYFYDEFMKHIGFYTGIEPMLAIPDFRTGFEAQDDMLDDLRDDIEEAETPQWVVDAFIEMNTGSAAGRRG